MKDIGERLSAYEPLWENWYKDSYLGSGGSGKVYRFRQELYGQVRYCAVKVLPIILDRSVSVTSESRERELAERRKQMAQEIKNMYLLGDKPHLVHCINHSYRDIVSDDGEVIGFDVLIQMEYYSTLTEYINRRGVLPVDEVERLARQIGEALTSMHGINMLHRDIKPENIYVDDSGNFYLGDFGIAKQTQAGSFATFAGTQPFMAPEVWNARAPGDQHYNKTADIYSLGITLYYLLNGNRLPMVQPGDSRNAVDAAIFSRLNGKVFPPPENGSRSLKDTVMACCAFDPADRIQSAESLLTELDKSDATVRYDGNIPASPAHTPIPLIREELPKADDPVFTRPEDSQRPAQREDDFYEEGYNSEYDDYDTEYGTQYDTEYETEYEDREPAHLSSATKKKALAIGLALTAILTVGLLFYTRVICIHRWTAATCVKLSTCEKCGKTRGTLAPHTFKDATCTQSKMCMVCGTQEGSPLGHDWQEATCTSPEYCPRCGEKRGEPLGHDWQEATCTEPRTCKVCGEKEGKPKGHDWKEATCLEPKTCKVCGVTEGKPGGHQWKDATCTDPKICKVCGTKEGKALGHDWKEATCTEPETCKRCGEVKGSPKGHTWEPATLTKPRTCSVCGATEGKALEYSEQGIMYVDTGGDTLALRQDKSASSQMLAQIPDCTQITVWNTGSSGWYYTQYDNKYGYVNSKYLSATDPMLGDGSISGWNSGALNDGSLQVTVSSAEVKNGRLNVTLSFYNDSLDMLWPEVKCYYNGVEDGSGGVTLNGDLMEKKDFIAMPYATREISFSCKVDKSFGKGSLNNLVITNTEGEVCVIKRN